MGSANDDDEEEARERRRRAREERKKMRDTEESGTTDVIDTNRYNVQKSVCGGTNQENKIHKTVNRNCGSCDLVFSVIRVEMQKTEL